MGKLSLLPGDSGAYALVIRLRSAFRGDVGALGSVALPAGAYAYLGSANGLGGIAARVGRHLRKEKPLHWHVDRLTAAGTVSEVATWPGGTECALVAALEASARVSIPVGGFGSSDCRTCRAHLLRLESVAASLKSLRAVSGVSVYSAASLGPSAATDPSTV
jgi:Uri superfamily endonuclease